MIRLCNKRGDATTENENQAQWNILIVTDSRIPQQYHSGLV